MDLGAFSLSLAVKDIHASRAFYEKLGFQAIGGDVEQNWLIMHNGKHTLGLFQGMFDKNTLTFTPGWGQAGEPLESFTDVRDLQRKLKADGLELITEVNENGSGPGFFMMLDPDGNPVLVDQHV